MPKPERGWAHGNENRMSTQTLISGVAGVWGPPSAKPYVSEWHVVITIEGVLDVVDWGESDMDLIGMVKSFDSSH